MLKKQQSEDVNNRIIKHDLKESALCFANCACCGKTYDFTIHPNLYVYPKHCDDHISPYKRELWNKLNS